MGQKRDFISKMRVGNTHNRQHPTVYKNGVASAHDIVAFKAQSGGMFIVGMSSTLHI